MRKFTVTFIDSETKAVICEKKVRKGKKLRMEDAVKTGDTFMGWSYAADGSKLYTEKNLVVDKKNIVLYAMWDKPIIRNVINLEDANMYMEFSYADEKGNVMKTDSMPLVANVPEKYMEYKKFAGWADENGELVVKRNYEGSVISVDLYPVFDCEVNDIEKDEEETYSPESFNAEDANMYVEFNYIDHEGNKVTTNLMPIIASFPGSIINASGFVGWAFEPNGEIVIGKDFEGSVLSFDLNPVGLEYVYGFKSAVTEEPVAEGTTEEVIEEVAEEAPVVEEVIEEAAEEAPVAEEVIEEAAEEAPVAEEVIEEAAEEALVVEEVIEEVVEETPVVEETIEEVPVAEETPVIEVVPVEPVVPTVVPTYIDNEGNHIDIKYSRSFISNIIQGDEMIKEYYSDLKNHILSYEGVKSRLSWKFDSYNRGRDQLFKIKIRGKTICIYLALDPDNYEVSKYHHEAIDAKIFEDVPMLFKIKSGLGLRKAKKLVDDTMERFGIPQLEKPKFVDYVKKYPYTETEELVQQKLVKVLVSDSSVTVKSAKKSKAVEEDDIDVVETPVVEEVVIEEAPIVEEVATVVEEVAVEEIPVVEAVEEVIEEAVEETPVVEDAPVAEEEIHIVESVSAEIADSLVNDEVVDKTVEEDVVYISKNDTKKDIVNVGILSNAYEAGEVVDLASLKAKKLVDPKTKYVKVLAAGIIDKPLTVKAQEFSETAIKMIVLTGGKVVKTKTVVK